MSELLVGRGYGRHVGLRIPAGVAATVRVQLPFWWQEVDAGCGEPEHVVTVDSGEGPEQAVRDLELWVAEHAVGFVFVHAGVVAFDGRALLLPGRSMSGKTTLVAALLRAGGDYLSDEYAVLDPDGRVHPYPRPLSIRTPEGVRHVDPAGLGSRTTTTPVPVQAVAALTYRDAAPWSVRPVGRTTAVLQLLDNAVAARSAHERVLTAVTAAVADATCVRGERGDVDQAVGLKALLHQG